MNEVFVKTLRQHIARAIKKPIVAIEQLDPDASARVYYRISFAEPVCDSKQTLLAMYFENKRVPEVGGGSNQPLADEAYVALSTSFGKLGIPVPKLILDQRLENFLLVEDCGSSHLIDELAVASVAVKEKLLNQAMSIIHRLQSVSLDDESIVFGRRFAKEILIREMSEFNQYFLPSFTGADEAIKQAKVLFDVVAAYIESMPCTLVHRDFHCWNILVEDGKTLRVIDFQDALIGPRCYDVASLLHDRDSDVLIGATLVAANIDSYLKQIAASRAEFFAVLLQRDLKVVGRFAKLVKAGKSKYQQWIPGTYRRVLTSLEKVSSEPQVCASAKALHMALDELSPVIERAFGAKN